MVLLPFGPADAVEIEGKARVVDGGTIVIGGDVVRLHEIDAPESGLSCRDMTGDSYQCGIVAASVLVDMIGSGPVTCSGDERDKYGRLIAVCRKAGRDINAKLVRLGWARAFQRYSLDYASLEAEAETGYRGLGAGQFKASWDFCREQWQVSTSAAPRAGCPTKGKISKNGRINHTPYSRDYERTKINGAKGERWFCTEGEALAVGWRAPRY